MTKVRKRTSCFSFILIILLGLTVFANAPASVTSEELGKMLLKGNYEKVNLDYNVYYSEGPTGPRKNDKGGWHPGIDYKARLPVSVYSPVTGTVDSFDKEGTGYGRLTLKIDGTNDYFIFLHLSKLNITSGQRIKLGDVVGKTGSTGAPAPHLHVEVREGRNTAAFYFKSRNDTGINKNPVSVISNNLNANQTNQKFNSTLQRLRGMDSLNKIMQPSTVSNPQQSSSAENLLTLYDGYMGKGVGEKEASILRWSNYSA